MIGSSAHPASSGGPADDDVPWLSHLEREAWLGLNGLLLKLPGLLTAQLERDADLNFFEYMVLAMLGEQSDGRLRMSRLAVLTSGSLSRLSHVVKRLEAQGFVRRETDPDDRRSTNAILTAAGRTKVTDTAPGHVSAVRELVFDNLSDRQVRQLAQIGGAILTHIDPEGSALPPTSG